MLKEFAWNTFINTGNIDAYVFFKEIEEKSRVLKEASMAEEEVAISN